MRRETIKKHNRHDAYAVEKSRTYSKFTGVLVISDVRDVDWILGRRDGRLPRRTDQVVHEAGEATFLLKLVCFAGLVAIALARASGARIAGAPAEVFHPPTCCY